MLIRIHYYVHVTLHNLLMIKGTEIKGLEKSEEYIVGAESCSCAIDFQTESVMKNWKWIRTFSLLSSAKNISVWNSIVHDSALEVRAAYSWRSMRNSILICSNLIHLWAWNKLPTQN